MLRRLALLLPGTLVFQTRGEARGSRLSRKRLLLNLQMLHSEVVFYHSTVKNSGDNEQPWCKPSECKLPRRYLYRPSRITCLLLF